jgi:hypothetical protein
MDRNTPNPGGRPQPEDPGATRYFPPQEAAQIPQTENTSAHQYAPPTWRYRGPNKLWGILLIVGLLFLFSRAFGGWSEDRSPAIRVSPGWSFHQPQVQPPAVPAPPSAPNFSEPVVPQPPAAPVAPTMPYSYDYHWGGPAYFAPFVMRLWPLALIILGIFLLYGRSRRRSTYQ